MLIAVDLQGDQQRGTAAHAQVNGGDGFPLQIKRDCKVRVVQQTLVMGELVAQQVMRRQGAVLVDIHIDPVQNRIADHQHIGRCWVLIRRGPGDAEPDPVGRRCETKAEHLPVGALPVRLVSIVRHNVLIVARFAR